MTPKVCGFIFRTKDRVKLQKFYSALGLLFLENQHGGPIHAECDDIDNDFVLEIYSASDKFPRDAIMLKVHSLATALEIAINAGGQIIHEAKEQDRIRFAYVADPDGRPVMLVECIS